MITYLISVWGSNYVPAYYLMGCAIAVVPILLIRETARLLLLTEYEHHQTPS